MASSSSNYIFLSFLLFLTSATSSLVNPHSFTPPRIPYSDHCTHIPDSPIDPSPSSVVSPASLGFFISFFSGGDSFFNRNQSSNGDIKSAGFRPISIRKTLGDGNIYKIDARLSLRISRTSWDGVSFDFSGFWSESTGRVCMVGSTQVSSGEGTDLKSFDARLMLAYSKNLNIYGSLVKGVLESVNKESSFETIWILAARNTPLNYEYKLLNQSISDCGKNSEESLSLENVVGGMCRVLGGRIRVFSLMYRNNRSRSPLGSEVDYTPSFISVLPFLCYGERMQMLLTFSNTSRISGFFLFDPRTTLVAEGTWDVKKNRFCGVACRILNFSDSLTNAVIDDCSLRLTFRVPAILSINNMAPVVGQLWSAKAENDPSYFRRIELSSLHNPLRNFLGVRYEYTESERVSKVCGSRKSHPRSKGNHYPDAQTSDMRFAMSVKYSGGEDVLRSGLAFPYFVGDGLSHDLLVRGGVKGIPMNINNVTNSFSNITYRIRFMNPVSESRGDIFAEGTYDRDTGELCMVGCQSVMLNSTGSMRNETFDCSLAIKIKFSPIDSRSDDRLKGTIESTREKTDPLYVGRMEILSRSIYVHEAKEYVRRMDLEVAMVLISNTLSCFFLGMQLYHMKKHQEASPFISITMLILLALGHMILLLLNFEELFQSSHDQQSLSFENDKWLETKEIVVRIVTMIALLLEFRVLQLAWTARKTEEHHNREGVWNTEKKVWYVCLPLYITGGLIAWLANSNRTPKRMVYIGKPRPRNLLYRPVKLKGSLESPPLWNDLKSYGGLMLDAFLLPQILFNGFSNSDTKALSALFYGGSSIVRLFPHAYDLYRSHSSGKILDWSFIYANHKIDYYSTAWDIIIICIGFLFAVLIFLQQRFGARCIIPMRFRENVGYEKVVELQQTGDEL